MPDDVAGIHTLVGTAGQILVKTIGTVDIKWFVIENILE